jgi:SAM-dependent methyltransferase
MANEFPQVWFDTFLAPDSAPPVHRELAFIQAHLPVTRYRRLLDVPCGIGRHAGPLAALGYEVLGVDRSEAALDAARSLYPRVEFRRLDMLALDALGEKRFDGILCLWQSFGFGDTNANRDLLRAMGRTLRPGGRLLMDIYNSDAVSRLPSTDVETRNGRVVRTSRARVGRRLRVELEYSDSRTVDVHDWEIYGPSDFEQLANEVGFDVRVSCAWFDAAVPPSEDHLRMQFLLERGA